MTSTPTQACASTYCEIRFALSAEDRNAVARLRYDVYVEEMARTQALADHAARTIHEPLDDQGIVIGAFLPDGGAIGTLRLNNSSNTAIACRELYGWEERELQFPGAVYLASKLIVAHAFRGTVLSLELMRAGASAAYERRWRSCFLDANDHLVALYTRMGFVARGRRQHPLFGTVTIMEWDMLDIVHMRAIRSPFLKVALSFVIEPACAA